jgi:hypothetical protein
MALNAAVPHRFETLVQLTLSVSCITGLGIFMVFTGVFVSMGHGAVTVSGCRGKCVHAHPRRFGAIGVEGLSNSFLLRGYGMHYIAYYAFVYLLPKAHVLV